MLQLPPAPPIIDLRRFWDWELGGFKHMAESHEGIKWKLISSFDIAQKHSSILSRQMGAVLAN